MPKSFEESINELEKIVHQLEEGDLSLEASLELFEKGVKLSRDCRDRLTKAERRIEVLMKDADGTLRAEPLEE
ncbi:MAG TPA: exodeoxyribonuclease VII small subunit [Pyrinomonadaceae bacterium]|nr:exodeoxyribonuclease VII small subunit [Pyrinomonadaceae bacterium]HMP66048.1 exodeoxyribonuclease VII small subunit [Pyrinomonadaceae bacterium]